MKVYTRSQMHPRIYYIVLALILAACTRPASTPPALVPDSAPSPTANPGPVGKPVFPETPPVNNPAARPTQELSPTKTAGPVTSLEGARIQTVGYIDVGIAIVVIEARSEVSGEYRAVVDGKEFSCTLQSSFPKNIYCSGPEPRGKQKVSVEVYPAGGDRLLFTGEAVFP